METKINQTMNETTTNVVNETKKNVAKKVAQAKANGALLDSILNKFAKGNSIGHGIKGQSVDMYRKELFAGQLDVEKKRTRKKLRNVRDGFAMEILNCKDKMRLQRLCKDFAEYYKQVYTVNDYSINSICSGRTDENTRNVLEKFLNIVKANLK